MFSFLVFLYLLVGVVITVYTDELTGLNVESFKAVVKAPAKAINALVQG